MPLSPQQIILATFQQSDADIRAIHARLSRYIATHPLNDWSSFTWREHLKNPRKIQPWNVTHADFGAIYKIISKSNFAEHDEVLKELLKVRGMGEPHRQEYLICLEYELSRIGFFENVALFKGPFEEFLGSYTTHGWKLSRDKEIVLRFERCKYILVNFGPENFTKDGADMIKPVPKQTSEKENCTTRAIRKIYEANCKPGGIFENVPFTAQDHDLHQKQIWGLFKMRIDNWRKYHNADINRRDDPDFYHSEPGHPRARLGHGNLEPMDEA